MAKKLVYLPIVAAILVLFSFVTTQAATTVWSVDGRTIKLNGQKFIVEGINYSPAPIGGNTAWQPFGDYFIPTWKTIYERDFPVLRKLGANSIRLYFTYPYVKNENYLNGPPADHSGFLKAAYNNGANPVYVFVAYPVTNQVYSYTRTPVIPPEGVWYYKEKEGYIWIVDEEYDRETAAPRRATQRSEYLTLAGQLAKDPAVMGFVISNEANNGIARHHPAFWKYLDELAAGIKKAAPGKLTLTALVDDSMESVKLAESLNNKMPNIDIWGINSYRGNDKNGFDVLFENFKKASVKPLLITEFGCPASTRDSKDQIVELPDNAKAQSDYIKVHWQDIVKNEDICSGGYVFAWNDEWWKNGNPPKHDCGADKNHSFPGGWADEEWYGINSVQANNRPNGDPWSPGQPNAPDLLGPRAAFNTLADLWK